MLGKVMQNGAQITNEYAKLAFKLIQNRSKNNPKIDSKIDAKSVIQKSIKNESWSAKGSPR